MRGTRYIRRGPGNRKNFNRNDFVSIGDGRVGDIVDFYEHDKVKFYRICWHSGEQPYSWHEARLIRKTNEG